MNRALVLAAIASTTWGCGDPSTPGKPAVPVTLEMITGDHPNQIKGALQVTGDTRDMLLISKEGKRIPGNPPLLKETIELDPGVYVVNLNKSIRTVTIQPGKKVILRSGSILVTKKGAAFWFPKQGDENRYTSNPPTSGSALSLFPGVYDVYVNIFPNNEKVAEGVKVSPGERVTLNP
jgi:hypothetical protein